LKYLTIAANMGNLSARHNLGVLYFQENKDLKMAIHHFTIAIDNNFTCSYTNLGYLYLLDKQYDLAFPLLLKAANRKDNRSYLQVGNCYRHGHGTRKNLYLVFKYYQMTDNQSSVNALATEWQELLQACQDHHQKEILFLKLRSQLDCIVDPLLHIISDFCF
jgi:TPR repeat protein